MPQECIGQMRRAAHPLDAPVSLLMTTARVGAVRLASSTAFGLDHKPSAGSSSGAKAAAARPPAKTAEC
jgi:hypothetical protein